MKNLRIFLILTFSFFLIPSLNAQLKQGQFAIVGTNNDYSMVQTSDMGFAIAGYTISYGAGGADVYVIN